MRVYIYIYVYYIYIQESKKIFASGLSKLSDSPSIILGVARFTSLKLAHLEISPAEVSFGVRLCNSNQQFTQSSLYTFCLNL